MLERYNDFLRHLDPFIPLQSLSQRDLCFKTSMKEILSPKSGRKLAQSKIKAIKMHD